MNKEELIKCWKSSASGSGSRNFFKDSSTLRDRALFHKLPFTSPERVKFLSQMYLWTRKSPLNFGSNPGPQPESRSAVRIQTRTLDPDYILLGLTFILCRRHLLPFYWRAGDDEQNIMPSAPVFSNSYSHIHLLPSPFPYIFNSPSAFVFQLIFHWHIMSFSRHFVQWRTEGDLVGVRTPLSPIGNTKNFF